MDANEMKYNFLLEYDNIASAGAPGYSDREVSFFLTKAQELFVKYGFNPYNSFEQTEKKRKDFSELKRQVSISSPSSSQSGVHRDGVFYDLPGDFLYALTEECKVSSNDPCLDGLYVYVKPVTEDYYNANIDNPYKKPFLSRGDGLVWRIDFSRAVTYTNPKRHELITDGTFGIAEYILRYIKRPVDIVPYTGDGTTSGQSDCELDESTHNEIIDIAVRLASASTNIDEYQVKIAEERINK